MNTIHLMLLCSLFFSSAHIFCEKPKSDKKIIICGVCRNVEGDVRNTIKNIECVGKRFSDYAVIIYENNSTDQTHALLNTWAKANPKVDFTSEWLSSAALPPTREEGIARARNIVLAKTKDAKYDDFDFILWADMDFSATWPIREIVNTVKLPMEWDCVSANGIMIDRLYYDRYAFRDKNYPLGPEIVGDHFWYDLRNSWFPIKGNAIRPVYSAFGGLAIYKKSSIGGSKYSGLTTLEYVIYYSKILQKLGNSNKNVCQFLQYQGLPIDSDLSKIYIKTGVTCCEHVTFHASMALKGHGKIYVNPKMYMYYQLKP